MQVTDQKRTIRKIKIEAVKVGDVVKHGGQLRTVSRRDLKKKKNGLITLFDDTYRQNTEQVEKIY